MTKAELIAALADYPDDTRVLVAPGFSNSWRLESEKWYEWDEAYKWAIHVVAIADSASKDAVVIEL